MIALNSPYGNFTAIKGSDQIAYNGFLTSSRELAQAIVGYITVHGTAERPITCEELMGKIKYAEPDDRAAMKAFTAVCSKVTLEHRHFHRRENVKSPKGRGMLGYWFDFNKVNENFGNPDLRGSRRKREKPTPKARTAPISYPANGPWAGASFAASAPSVAPEPPELQMLPAPTDDPLYDHVERMQEMMQRYVAPGPYVEREGKSSADVPYQFQEAMRSWMFAQDMVYMLDGPEQREAMV